METIQHLKNNGNQKKAENKHPYLTNKTQK